MKRLISILFLILLIFITLVFGQGKKYEGPDDPAGDIAAVRAGVMNGNRVYLYFKNTTELSNWYSGEVGPEFSGWPYGPDAQRMLDGVGLLVGAKVFIKKSSNPTPTNPDTIPETDITKIIMFPNNYHTLYFLQTSYREEMDYNPVDGTPWGFYPVFGYFNETQDYPAMSNKPNSWPPEGWPAPYDQLKWPGEWNGRFGRGVMYADLETYFVVNDAQDQEYLGPEDYVKYYPRPGRKIGDKRPSVTIQKGEPWGGIGIRIETRGYQWNNPQARDCIFWEYNIANISEYHLTQVCFGYWVDNGIGGEADDEIAYFNKLLDMAYSWDNDETGYAGGRTGIMGFAYLESPGLPYDGIDNDDDGLIDEQRDNPATRLVGPTEDIADINKFLAFYRLKMEDLHEHWDADEDQDWQDGEDLNGDGVYQITEFAGDDVGLDGVGPGELNYTGPDEGECNHMPDYKEGVGCEPNFAATDVSESDMVGLTSFRMFPIQSHAQSNTTIWFKNDDVMWEILAADTLMEYYGVISNLVEVFASGPFPLYKGRTERISMSELHAYDPLEGLESEQHTAPALFELKRIVQVIYERDYRFASPPEMPTLTATPGDRKVILTWDDVADTRTRDPFVGNVNDFEGYKLYRATDPYFHDAQVITDGYGTPMFYKPIYQCDLKDGKQGFTDFGLVNGMGYFLGSETGITHYFIDNNVQNGRTYYYGLVAYDYGAPDIGPGIAPSENNLVIEMDENENIIGYGKNIAVVVPTPPSAGYVPPETNIRKGISFIGSGEVIPELLALGALKSGHEYCITFDIDTVHNISGLPEIINDYDHGLIYTTSGYKVFNLTEDTSLVYYENSSKYSGDNINRNDTLNYYTIKTGGFYTDVFDGIRLNIVLNIETPTFDFANSGWIEGYDTLFIMPSARESKYFPWEYNIVFGDQYTGVTDDKTGIRDESDTRIRSSQILTHQTVPFTVYNILFKDSTGNYERMDILIQDVNEDGLFEINEDKILVGALNKNGDWAGTIFVIDFLNSTVPPNNGVYRVTFKRPFWKTDSLYFSITATDTIDREELANNLKDVKIVPNPYICTNEIEPAVANPYLNQPRRLMFKNIPAKCTIKIFTVSGVLVDEIHVNNPIEKGVYVWDMLTREGLEIAAGMYIYYIKAEETGDEVMGKFAVIK
ncbi:MAG: hypothetical protein H0Z29_04290 [Candidatus Marinimicrobia bacterium]|nr:hypothetical protein [Candidatus Neomarinimicrobiota bacterium]